MALPRKLRNLVYDHIVAHFPKIIDVTSDRLLKSSLSLSPSTVVAGHTVHPTVTCLPNITYTHAYIYQELVPKFLKTAYLQVGSAPNIPYLENLFDTLPTGKGWDLIRNITILDIASIARSPGRAREVIDTTLQARNLEVLVINFKLQGLWCPPDLAASALRTTTEEARAMQANLPKTVGAEYLMRKWNLEHLFEMVLKRWIMRVDHGVSEHTPRSIGVLNDLKRMIMEGL